MYLYGCGINYHNGKREDCYFYHEEKDMGATVPCCTYFGGYGNCPCSNDCEKFVGKYDISKIAVEYVDNRKNKC